VIGLALLALALKLAIAYSTIGTNDTLSFYGFAKELSQHRLEWTYQHSYYFNHPPLIAYYLQFIGYLSHQEIFHSCGVTFPFLLRLPGIVADFIVVLVLLRLSGRSPEFRVPTWALALFAISPVSLMVSGFHGNTDPVMVMFLVLAGYMCLRERPVLSGIFFALSCQIKVIPLLVLPIIFFFWLARGAARRFAVSFVLLSVIMWAQPLTKFPTLFLKNVLAYNSFWGLWGITYWLRLTQLRVFSTVTFFNLPPAEFFVVNVLKLLIVISVLTIAWRRRVLHGRALVDSIAYAWIIFFVFSPGVGVQYMVWLAPFVLVLSPSFYGWLTAASTVFLFFFYDITANGFPWYIAISTKNLNTVWTPWSLWPWAVLIAGLFYLWRKAIAANPSLRLFSIETLRAEKI